MRGVIASLSSSGCASGSVLGPEPCNLYSEVFSAGIEVVGEKVCRYAKLGKITSITGDNNIKCFIPRGKKSMHTNVKTK